MDDTKRGLTNGETKTGGGALKKKTGKPKKSIKPAKTDTDERWKKPEKAGETEKSVNAEPKIKLLRESKKKDVPVEPEEKVEIPKERWSSKVIAFGWVMATSVIIAASHVTFHLSSIAVFKAPEAAFTLFFIPLLCSIALPFLAKFSDIKYAVYAGVLSGIIAMALLVVVLYAPSILGTVLFMEGYSVNVMRQIFMSAIGILPSVIVGSVIGGALASD
jgi:hypothetical protein